MFCSIGLSVSTATSRYFSSSTVFIASSRAYLSLQAASCSSMYSLRSLSSLSANICSSILRSVMSVPRISYSFLILSLSLASFILLYSSFSFFCNSAYICSFSLYFFNNNLHSLSSLSCNESLSVSFKALNISFLL